jgi:hypothetical protein
MHSRHHELRYLLKHQHQRKHSYRSHQPLPRVYQQHPPQRSKAFHAQHQLRTRKLRAGRRHQCQSLQLSKSTIRKRPRLRLLMVNHMLTRRRKSRFITCHQACKTCSTPSRQRRTTSVPVRRSLQMSECLSHRWPPRPTQQTLTRPDTTARRTLTLSRLHTIHKNHYLYSTILGCTRASRLTLCSTRSTTVRTHTSSTSQPRL